MATKDFITYTKNGNVINVIAAKNIGAARSTNLSISGKGITLNLPINQKEGTGDFYLKSVTILEPRYSVSTTYKFEFPNWFVYGDILEIIFHKAIYNYTRYTVRFDFDRPEDLLLNPNKKIQNLENTGMSPSSIEDSYISSSNGFQISGLTSSSSGFSHTAALVEINDSTKRLLFKISGTTD